MRQDILSYEYARRHFLSIIKKQSVSVPGKPGLTETDCFSFVLLTAPVRWNGKDAVLFVIR